MNTNHTGTGWDLTKDSQIQGLELRKSDPDKEFWDYAKVVFHPKFRKQLQANPSKKWYGIWSAEDLKNRRLSDPPTAKDVENQAYALSTHNTTSRLQEIKNPTLILAASHDRACPKSELMFMHEKIPNSTFVLIEKSGHFSFLSKAPEINQILLKFLMD
jgi:pimeloyl-ACP methyl ester carboxylesterase